MPKATGRANGTKELPRERFLSDSFTVGYCGQNAPGHPIPATLPPQAKDPKSENLYHFYQSLQAGSRSKQCRRTQSPWLSQQVTAGQPSIGTPLGWITHPGTWVPSTPRAVTRCKLSFCRAQDAGPGLVFPSRPGAR